MSSTGYFVLNGDKTQPSAPALLQLCVLDSRSTMQEITDIDFPVERYRTASPHPSREWHRGQKVAAFGMTVRTETRTRCTWLGQTIVYEHRRTIADLGRRIPIERGVESPYKCWSQHFCIGLFPANPFSQLFNFDRNDHRYNIESAHIV